MIRVIQRRLIIPRGDTGTFTVPALSPGATGSVGVFTIFDPITKIRVFQKKVDLDGDVFNIEFSHGDTVNLQAGDYLWDIKFYKDPVIENGKVISGTEIDSYYAAFQTPKCEIRETGDDFMTIEGTPVKVEDLNIILAATQAANAAKVAAEASATEAAEKLEQMVAAIPTKISDLVDDSGHYTKPAEGIPASDLEETYLTEHQDLSNYVQKTDYASDNVGGVVKIRSDETGGVKLQNGALSIAKATDYDIKGGTQSRKPIVPISQHQSAFYGLAKAAGDTTQSQSDNMVGTYTDAAKAAIQAMLDVPSTADIPTNVSELTNDAGYLTQHQDISGKANSADLAAVATSGAYSDLSGTPTNVSTFTNDAGYLTEHQDVSGFATKTDTVLETTLSRGRKEGTAVGIGSFAFGSNVEASGDASQAEGMSNVASGLVSHAEGAQTEASGDGAHAEGDRTKAIGLAAHAEGIMAQALGNYSHSEGIRTQANGIGSHAEGNRTVANGAGSHVLGIRNVPDGYDLWSEWAANTNYSVGDQIKITTASDDETAVTGYICKTANSDAEFTGANWTKDVKMNYVEIVGNGTADNARSNAYALSWEGDGKYAGDVYINCNTDSSGGTKVLSVADFATDLDIQNIINGGAGA